MKTVTRHAATRLLPVPLGRDRTLAEDVTLIAVAFGKAREELWLGLGAERADQAVRWAEQWKRVSPDERHRALDRRFSPDEASAVALRSLGHECGSEWMEVMHEATPSFLRFVFEGRPRGGRPALPGRFGTALIRRLVRECVGPPPSRTPGVGSGHTDGRQ
jgi:hypothetical protein